MENRIELSVNFLQSDIRYALLFSLCVINFQTAYCQRIFDTKIHTQYRRIHHTLKLFKYQLIACIHVAQHKMIQLLNGIVAHSFPTLCLFAVSSPSSFYSIFFFLLLFNVKTLQNPKHPHHQQQQYHQH